ncbi:PREDICTED: uncharacterized protein LOC108619123 [Drosophila arizonae]|uniref:Uncharacterized protein LOC108619123 n=1 Tax=Drosophila arizonae TaxID=7263 RepID=A0ABM1PUS5_DROAR|nr:PREDICTED: uncharacterized protein LOC108619123 [Drosophila arizonae]
MEAESNISIVREKSENPPSVYLSDVDDISDIDVDDAVDKLHKTITSKPVYDEKRSIFNTTLDLADAESTCECASTDVDAYVASVAQEKQLWESFTTKILQKQDEGKAVESEYKPSEEQQAYLSKGPNLQNFIRGFSSFMDDGNAFIRQFEMMQDLQENLKNCCQFDELQKQQNCISEALANEISIRK